MILENATREERADKEFVLSALTNKECNGTQFKYAMDELKSDKEFVLKVVKLGECSLGAVSDYLRKDKDVILAAVAYHGYAFSFVPEELTGDKKFILQIIENLPENHTDFPYWWISYELQIDNDVIDAASKKGVEVCIKKFGK